MKENSRPYLDYSYIYYKYLKKSLNVKKEYVIYIKKIHGYELQSSTFLQL